MIRVAAAGDLHFSLESKGTLSPYLAALRGEADLLLLAGDLTRGGRLEEAATLAEDLRGCPVPVAVVLGNHDYHQNQEKGISEILAEAGICVLEKTSAVFSVRGLTVGVAGAKGFGGGFLGACGTEYGEPEMKAFMQATKRQAAGLKACLSGLACDYKIALLHYAPIPETLLGERKEIYPFLGSYHLAEAVDEAGADIIFHGHAHRGVEKGTTAGGIPVRNVAQSVIQHVYNLYTLEKDALASNGSLADAAVLPPPPPLSGSLRA